MEHTTLVETMNTIVEQNGGATKVKSYDQLFNASVLTKKIGINVGELMRNSDKKTKDILEGKLKIMYEGLCITEGYVKYDSIKILSYSMGVMKGDEFEYYVVFECSICNPSSGEHIKCDVKNITKAGLRCEIADLPQTVSKRQAKSPLVVFIARDYYYDDDEFNSIKENDIISVEIIGTRYELNDDYIVVFGDLVK